MTAVRVARIVQSTEAEGPGHRTAIWVQGCSIRCDGCFNPHLFAARGGNLWEPERLAEEVLAPPTQGLTILGGEPFDQASALSQTAAAVRMAGRSVMTFTGFTWLELEQAIAAGRADFKALITATDLLVTGPFLRDAIDRTRPWVGSTNQEFHFLTGRYEHLRHELGVTPDRLEIRVASDGVLAVNGWATADQLDALLEGLAVRRHTGGSGATPP